MVVPHCWESVRDSRASFEERTPPSPAVSDGDDIMAGINRPGCETLLGGSLPKRKEKYHKIFQIFFAKNNFEIRRNPHRLSGSPGHADAPGRGWAAPGQPGVLLSGCIVIPATLGTLVAEPNRVSGFTPATTSVSHVLRSLFHNIRHRHGSSLTPFPRVRDPKPSAWISLFRHQE